METLIFCKMRLGQPAKKNNKSYGLWETLEIIGKSMVSSLRSWQRVTATQGGSQRTVRDHARIPLKTLEFLMFSDGPQPVNWASLEIPLADHAKSYGLWETLEIIGKSVVSCLRSWQRVTASIVFSRQGTHGRVCCQKNNKLIFWPEILGNLIARHVIWKVVICPPVGGKTMELVHFP